MGHLSPAVAADEEDQIGFVEDLIGASPGVRTRGADGQGVLGGKHGLGVQGGRHRNGELLGEGDELGSRVRGGHPAAGHDDGPPGLGQQVQRFFNFAPELVRVPRRLDGFGRYAPRRGAALAATIGPKWAKPIFFSPDSLPPVPAASSGARAAS